jgi:5-methylcytosine-specific restriction enzyme A
MMMTTAPDATRIAASLSHYYGLPLTGHTRRDKEGAPRVELYPSGIHQNDGFCVQLTLGWRSLRGEFVPGPFAGPLIQEMGRASHSDKRVFCALAERISREGGTLELEINGKSADPTDSQDWPTEWHRLALAMGKSPVAVNTDGNEATEKALLRWGGWFLAGIIALAPLEEPPATDQASLEGLPEGAKVKIEVNRYERSRFARAACIEINGESCTACGFDFGRTFGELGRGFIHVHHIIPVSEMGGQYQVNPAVDLVPVCPNCHAMLHKRTPPLSVGELRSILADPQ